MIISLISQKGGVGKSALARLIAVEYIKAGASVKIADLDAGAGSTSRWAERRTNRGILPAVNTQHYTQVASALAEADHYDLMILDGPAFPEHEGPPIAKDADLVIMPSGFSIDDLEPQVEAAYKLEDGGIDPGKIVFVFCRIAGSRSEDAGARSYLEKAGLMVAGPVFPERPSIRHAHNQGRAASEASHASVRNSVLSVAQTIADHCINRHAW